MRDIPHKETEPMKNSIGIAVALLVALALPAAAPVAAQDQHPNVCLNTTEIRNSQAVDARTILFKMRDGKVWRNTLAARCPDLVSQSAGAFSQTVHTDFICANVQHITVVSTGMVCRLGEFERIK
jgi:hypothetical protein